MILLYILKDEKTEQRQFRGVCKVEVGKCKVENAKMIYI